MYVFVNINRPERELTISKLVTHEYFLHVAFAYDFLRKYLINVF